MYITPAPSINDDPLYALRLGLIGMLAYAMIPIIDPALPSMIAALPIGLIAAQRKAFEPVKAIAGPITMIVAVLIISWLVEQLRPMPLVYVSVIWLIYFKGFHMILKSGSPAGMLLLIITVLMSIMGMNGNATLESMRDGFIQASLVALVLAPIAYMVFPARTKQKHVDKPVPSEGNIVLGAAIRASVLLMLSFWLYLVMQPSDMMMAIIAAMVLVFPTRHAVFFEAKQRVRATLLGGVTALIILLIFTFSQHLLVLLGLIFLAGIWFGTKMLHSSQPSMVYQYAFSVALALIAGALSTQDAGYATFTRIILTIIGAFSAAFLVAALDALTNWQQQRTDIA
ncbi:FUSC family protein [Rheinheimera salexigens]|uniref:Integral membrane bound transporter domain-containing protein n=1 Tax=Rheinheimera salexigens TaxID=1628148 RepID=A0A1E7Q9Y9_9GAMM|nr:FUSC family protein [Rheinheimera salexigens]OEY70828.1 hypothetical protein BI198_15635 [Rheinheimera salexigens]